VERFFVGRVGDLSRSVSAPARAAFDSVEQQVSIALCFVLFIVRAFLMSKRFSFLFFYKTNQIFAASYFNASEIF